jgi:hypothetical protein
VEVRCDDRSGGTFLVEDEVEDSPHAPGWMRGKEDGEMRTYGISCADEAVDVN